MDGPKRARGTLLAVLMVRRDCGVFTNWVASPIEIIVDKFI